MPSNVIPVFAAAFAVIVVAGTLLILLGCRVTNAEMPSIIRATWVNVTGVGAVCLVNALVAALLSPLIAMLGPNPESMTNIIRQTLQIPADIAILALTYWLLLEKLSYRRALVVAVIVAAGLAGVIFLTTYAVQEWMPKGPPPGPERIPLREARVAVVAQLG